MSGVPCLSLSPREIPLTFSCREAEKFVCVISSLFLELMREKASGSRLAVCPGDALVTAGPEKGGL